jgi:glycosyltransferase involved in cell wall biosynthesis
MALFFWLALFIVFWTYLGYFLALLLISRVHRRTVQMADIEPPVTMVVTAHDEARRIKQKLENMLKIDYPREKMEIIIVSDGSTDGTDEIVKTFADEGVRLLRIPERQGKHFGQGRGIQHARSEIVILSDATTYLEPDAVRKIVRNFADPTIGVVSGTDQARGENLAQSGEGAYVRYEMKLRELEGWVGSLVGASGCFFAIRKELAREWIDDMSSDFYMPIVAHKNGFRTVPETEAIGYYELAGDPQREFSRKVRTVLHGLEVLFQFSEIMNVFRYGGYSLQMISHKLMRWLAPFALLILLVANLSLLDSGSVYRWIMAGQLALYIMAGIAALYPSLQKVPAFKVPFFFVMVNVSIILAWVQYLKGEKQVVWEATQR